MPFLINVSSFPFDIISILNSHKKQVTAAVEWLMRCTTEVIGFPRSKQKEELTFKLTK